MPNPKSCGRTLLTGVAVLAALQATGCGGKKETKASPNAPTPLAIQESQKGDKYELKVPKSVEAGLVQISFTNGLKNGEAEAQLVRILGNHTSDDAVRALANAAEGDPIPDWLRAAGGVGSTAPGGKGTSTQELEAGSYAVIDSNYAQKGAVAELEVSGEPQEKPLPKTTATVTAKDYEFSTSGLKTGKNTILFNNVGDEPHHVVAAAVKPGTSIEEVKDFLEDEKGQPPLEAEGGAETAVIDGGKKQVTQLELKKPGRYALMCFITDREGGPPHVAKGMVQAVTVKGSAGGGILGM